MNDLAIQNDKQLATSIATNDIDVQISTAKAYPRKLNAVINDAITMATYNEDTAESCIYSVPKGGKTLKGKSIRLAEIMMSNWGNCYAGAHLVEVKNGSITAEGQFWDLEKNVKIRKQYVKDINNNTLDTQKNAAISSALRNGILAGIPGPLSQLVYDAAKTYLVSDKSKLLPKIKSAFEKFHKNGVDNKTILDFFGKKNISEIDEQDYLELVGIANAIKAGDVTFATAFKRNIIDNQSADDLAARLSEIPELSQADKEFYGEQ